MTGHAILVWGYIPTRSICGYMTVYVRLSGFQMAGHAIRVRVTGRVPRAGPAPLQVRRAVGGSEWSVRERRRPSRDSDGAGRDRAGLQLDSEAAGDSDQARKDSEQARRAGAGSESVSSKFAPGAGGIRVERPPAA